MRRRLLLNHDLAQPTRRGTPAQRPAHISRGLNWSCMQQHLPTRSLSANRSQQAAAMAQPRTPATTTLLLLLLGAAVALALPGAAAAFTWTPCDADKAPFKASDVALTPDPPVAGGSVTFDIQTAAVRDVPSGRIALHVAYAGTPIYEMTDDLCSKTACPIKPGPMTIKYVQELPPISPPGDYDVQVVASDTAGAELLCVNVHFSMLPPSPSLAGRCAAAAKGALVRGAALARQLLLPGRPWALGSRGSGGVLAATRRLLRL